MIHACTYAVLFCGVEAKRIRSPKQIGNLEQIGNRVSMERNNVKTQEIITIKYTHRRRIYTFWL